MDEIEDKNGYEEEIDNNNNNENKKIDNYHHIDEEQHHQYRHKQQQQQTINTTLLTSSSSENDNKNIIKLDIQTILEMTEMSLSKKIMVIKKEFKIELRQINLILALIWHLKGKDMYLYLGATIHQIIKGLKDYDKYFLYKTKSYVKNLLDLMVSPTIALLEFSESNQVYNITNFGLHFYNA